MSTANNGKFPPLSPNTSIDNTELRLPASARNAYDTPEIVYIDQHVDTSMRNSSQGVSAVRLQSVDGRSAELSDSAMEFDKRFVFI